MNVAELHAFLAGVLLDGDHRSLIVEVQGADETREVTGGALVYARGDERLRLLLTCGEVPA